MTSLYEKSEVPSWVGHLNSGHPKSLFRLVQRTVALPQADAQDNKVGEMGASVTLWQKR